MQQQVAATVTINDKGYRNVRGYKSLDEVAAAPPKSKAEADKDRKRSMLKTVLTFRTSHF